MITNIQCPRTCTVVVMVKWTCPPGVGKCHGFQERAGNQMRAVLCSFVTFNVLCVCVCVLCGVWCVCCVVCVVRVYCVCVCGVCCVVCVVWCVCVVRVCVCGVCCVCVCCVVCIMCVCCVVCIMCVCVHSSSPYLNSPSLQRVCKSSVLATVMVR